MCGLNPNLTCVNRTQSAGDQTPHSPLKIVDAQAIDRPGKVTTRTKGNNPQTSITQLQLTATDQAIHYLVDRPVATNGDYPLKALGEGLVGQFGSATAGMGGIEGIVEIRSAQRRF